MKLIPPSRQQAIDAVKILLSYIGEDPNREGLLRTPERVIKAWEKDWGIGYDRNYKEKEVESIRGALFADGAANYDQFVLVKKIFFYSHCEHHMALFSGRASIAYIPSKKGKVLGLSKLVRIVNMYSRRLQVQERLTNNIADTLVQLCNPLGVGVILSATHMCMCSRGVRQFDTETITAALRGQILKRPEVRSEFYKLVG